MQPKKGVEHGPSQLISNGLPAMLEDLGWRVHFDLSVPLTYDHLKPALSDPSLPDPHHHLPTVPPKLKNVKFVAKVAMDVAAQVKKICSQGGVALTLGGDHSLALGTVSGSLAVYPDVGILWVDAHAVGVVCIDKVSNLTP